MSTFNWIADSTWTAAKNLAGNADLTGPIDLNIYNKNLAAVQYASSSSGAPGVNFDGMDLRQGDKDPVKLSTGEKLYLRIDPDSLRLGTAAKIVGIEVPV